MGLLMIDAIRARDRELVLDEALVVGIRQSCQLTCWPTFFMRSPTRGCL